MTLTFLWTREQKKLIYLNHYIFFFSVAMQLNAPTTTVPWFCKSLRSKRPKTFDWIASWKKSFQNGWTNSNPAKKIFRGTEDSSTRRLRWSFSTCCRQSPFPSLTFRWQRLSFGGMVLNFQLTSVAKNRDFALVVTYR